MEPTLKQKYFIALLLSLFLSTSASWANNTLPNDELYITQKWFSLTTGYSIESKTQKFGAVYRKLLSLLLTYDFYDALDNQTAYARAKFFSLNAHFDIYDMKDQKIGSAEEQLLSFFPTFEIYDSTGTIRQAKAKMNFWGTTFYIYDPATDQEMAQLYRSFFRLKNDWTFKITNPMIFNQKNIDSRVLLTVIAFQGDREYWDSQNNSSSTYSFASDTSQSNIQLSDLDLSFTKTNAATTEKLSNEELVTVANELEQDFANRIEPSNSAISNKQRVKMFVEYCKNLINSNDVPAKTKQAIIQLLKLKSQNKI